MSAWFLLLTLALFVSPEVGQAARKHATRGGRSQRSSDEAGCGPQLEPEAGLEPELVLVKPAGGHFRFRPSRVTGGRLERAGLDAGKPTTVLIGGWQQKNSPSSWTARVESLYRESGLIKRENLLHLDYEQVSSRNYQFAASAARAVGQLASRFLWILVEEMGGSASHIRLVGASLGAHVAGFMARSAPVRVGRIVAVDPAGPCFASGDRLRPEDARQVHVQHYDVRLLGNPDSLGTRDVFVNGGVTQPGLGGSRALGGSHQRAFAVVSAKLTRTGGCQEVAYECSSWAAFVAGRCGRCDRNRCHLMSANWQHPGVGELADDDHADTGNATQKLYIKTSARAPFCLHHWQLIAHAPVSPSNALVELHFAGKQAPPLRVELTLAGSGRLTGLGTSEARATRPTGAQVLSGQLGDLLEVRYLSSIDAGAREALSVHLCAPADQPERLLEC